MIKIIADSVCDLSFELLEEYDIDMIPLKVTMESETYDDRINLTREEFFRQIKIMEGMPKTAAPAPEVYKEAFQNALKTHESIICYTLSSNASTSYQNASIAAKEVGGKIDIIDTRTAGFGEGLNVLMGARMAKEGVPQEEIVRLSKDRVNRMRTIVLLDTMEYLQRGGRISTAAAKMGSILRIKPIIQFQRDGTIGLLHRARGFNRGLEWLADYTVSVRKDFTNITVAIAYAENPDIAYEFIKLLEERTELGEVIVGGVGTVVGSHVGSNGVGVFFEEDEKYTKNDF